MKKPDKCLLTDINAIAEMMGGYIEQEEYIMLPTAWLSDPRWLKWEVDDTTAYIDISLMLKKHQDECMENKSMSKMERMMLMVNASDLAERWGWKREDVIKFLTDLSRAGLLQFIFLWQDDYAIYINLAMQEFAFRKGDRRGRKR